MLDKEGLAGSMERWGRCAIVSGLARESGRKKRCDRRSSMKMGRGGMISTINKGRSMEKR